MADREGETHMEDCSICKDMGIAHRVFIGPPTARTFTFFCSCAKGHAEAAKRKEVARG